MNCKRRGSSVWTRDGHGRPNQVQQLPGLAVGQLADMIVVLNLYLLPHANWAEPAVKARPIFCRQRPEPRSIPLNRYSSLPSTGLGTALPTLLQDDMR
jgi:hypothetical protein